MECVCDLCGSCLSVGLGNGSAFTGIVTHPTLFKFLSQALAYSKRVQPIVCVENVSIYFDMCHTP